MDLSLPMHPRAGTVDARPASTMPVSEVTMFRRILVPLDGSALAEAALPHAAALAAAFDARIHLLRVIPVRQRGGAAPLDIIDRRLGQAEAAAYLEGVAVGLRVEGRSVETGILEGHPAEQVVDALHAHEVDLLVLTSHGAGGCTDFPISGTAHKILSRAGISVVMVPTPVDRLARTANGPYRRILIGLDGSRRGEWALAPAAAIARHAGAELVFAHVVQVPETIEEPPSGELRDAAERLVRLNRQAAARHLAEMRSRVEGADLRVRTRLEVSATVPEALAGLAEAEHADLVTLTAHGASASPGRPYGVIAAQMLAEARLPVLIVQDAPRHAVTRVDAGAQRETALNHR